MFTLEQAAKYLGIPIADIENHLDLRSGHGYIFRDKNGDQIVHDGDIERIMMRLSYAKQLAAEKKALLEQHGVATIDL